MATGDLAYTPFNHQHPFPPDLRMQRDTINARDVISAPIRWEGMLVYVLENQKTYQLQGGLTNEYWVEFLGSGGSDISNAVLYTIQNLTPEQQLQARLNIGASELLDGLISLGAVTSNVNDVTIASVEARINGIIVGQNSPVTINVPPPTAGYTRRDLIVIGADSIIYLVQGVEVLESETAITPDIPEDTVVLVETFANDTGLQDFYDFAYATFVRFDIDSQNLSPEQKRNATTNIGALKDFEADSREGALTQNGLFTLNGDYVQVVLNDTASARAWQFNNPSGGGAYFQRRGGLSITAKGDSLTNYFIIRGFDNTETEVFRVRQGGVTKGGNAINLDDFVTLGQVNGLIEGSEETAYTEMSGDDFFIGYRVDGSERIEVIFDKDDKDVIVTDVGNIILNPSQSVGNFIFTGNGDSAVTEIRGIEGAIDGREIHLTNRSGAIIPIIDSYVGGPANSAFGFAYNLADGETISVEAISGVWELNELNQVAFSDNIDSVNADDIVTPDGPTLKLNIINPHTLLPVGYKEVTDFIDGTTMNDSFVDEIIYKKLGSSYFAETGFLNGNPINVRDFGAKGDGITDDTIAFQNAALVAKATSIETSDLHGRGFHIPSGTYKITDTIELYDSCTIFGDGQKISIIKSEIVGNEKHVFQFFRLTGSLTGITARDFSIEGLHAGASEGYAFRFDGNSVNTFKNLTIRGLGGGAMWLTGGYVNWIQNCYLGFNAKNSFYSTVDGTQDFAVIYTPRVGTGNSLHVTNCYISNNTIIDGIHFTGQSGRIRNCTIESGQRLIVLGEYATASRAIHIDDCYFEASRKYDIDIRQAQEVVVTNTYHNDTVGNTIAALKIGTLSNATFDTCHFGVRGIEVDRSSGDRTRSNIAFERCYGVTFNGGDHGLSGIRVIDNSEYDYPYGGYGLSKNLAPYSDDITQWALAGTPTLTQNEIFLDGKPAYSMSSTSAQAIYLNLTGVTVGEKLCFSFFIKGVSTVYARFRGPRISDGLSEDFGAQRFLATNKWKRVYISTTIADHSGTIQLRITTGATGTAICRAQPERGVLSPRIPIYNNGTSVIADNILGVTNGDHILHGVVQKSADGSLFRRSSNDDGSYNVEKWVSTAWVVQGINPLVLSSSATLDFGDILAGESATLTATVTGAALLDNVNVSGPASIYSANATIDGWVSSTDTVSVRVRNFGGTTINPASGTFNIKVFK